MRYYYRLSKTIWFISIIVSIGIILAINATFGLGSVLGYVIAALLTITLICALGVMPIYLEEDEKKFKLRLLFFTINLNKSEYSVIKIEPKELDGSIRTFGSGGLFGYTGMFYSRKMGHYRAFIANIQKPMLLFTKKKKIIIVNAPN